MYNHRRTVLYIDIIVCTSVFSQIHSNLNEMVYVLRLFILHALYFAICLGFKTLKTVPNIHVM